ncbi:sodium-dependent glucose transporter 1A-like [Pomacea canaliculata]|uniref:sodium-dependent glucose transporter 1A-like n=1 Tax=Pomacea canaliculata TaxID=400727 RepID=UPI000D73D5DB|nr:sodium-dependent glucose transporter 1A-like [Pomacea canaliculata]XP_025094850.1 sodium-dependent glucose transporter 1A-like [Pomacea canaliculata]XP_025094851.1 sodium-dependent glucose transporter 1A-like [Pomacea canaliculata]XP_025094852.1 sodium-dependent glucose transporter 1A-like [Pomacea canaliculata]
MALENVGDAVTLNDKQTEKQLSPEGTPTDTQNAVSGFRTKLKLPEYRRRCLRTLWLGLSFCALGFAVGQRGPAFLDIQIITQTDVKSASFFFTAASVGYLVGSLTAGMVYDKLNKSLLLIMSLLGLSFTTIALPWCSPYVLMIMIHFLCSMCAGSVDTVGNAELVRIWGNEGEMAMQFLHFAFAFGGVISPLITAPFLTPVPEEDGQGLEANTSVLLSNASSNGTNNNTGPALPLSTDVHYAFLISGIFMFLPSLPLTMQWFTDRSEKRRQSALDEKKAVKQPLPSILFIFVLLMLCLMYFLYCSVEDTFAAFLSTFVVKHLLWSKAMGAEITSVFWASFASARFLSIFVVRYVSSVKLLFICCTMMVFSEFGFLLSSQFHFTIGVWVCTVLAGISMSSIFPTGFLWMEEEFVRVTGRVASSILVASSSGTMVNPIALGALMQNLTPMWFPYLLSFESLLCLCVMFFLFCLSRLYLRKHYIISEVRTLEIVAPTLAVDGDTTHETADV